MTKQKGTVLVVGGAGYLGSVMTKQLVQQNYKVKVLDNLLYKQKTPGKNLTGVSFIGGDARDKSVIKRSLKGTDYVISLFSLVGDAICSQFPQLAYETNVVATSNLARFSNGRVKKFIYASTCSVYGYNNNFVNEESPLNPVSFYAWTKIHAEKHILTEAEKGLDATVFRMSTLHGLSSRMRFDLFVNRFAADAYFNKKITLWGGEQWRPVLDVGDAVSAYLLTLKASKSVTKGQIYNLGSDIQNYKIKKVAQLVADKVIGTSVENTTTRDEERNYKVKFNKIKKSLKFKAKNSLATSVNKILNSFGDGMYVDYQSARYINFLKSKKQKERIWEKLFLAGN